MGVHAVILSGGEPLLRREIYGSISYLCEKKIVPVLLTNGTLLPDTWEKLGEAGLRYVIISIDSVDPEIYEKHRGISFRKAEAGIDAAIRMMERFPGTEVHVSAVLERDNFRGFSQLVKYMNDRNIKVQISPLHDFFRIDTTVLPEERRTVTEFTEKVLAYKQQGGLISSSEGFIRHLPEFFCEGHYLPKDFVCKVGYNSLFIDALLNVKCCWDQAFEPLGNIREHSIRDIWYGEKMQEYRKRMLSCKCSGCWYMCTAENTLILDEIKERKGKD